MSDNEVISYHGCGSHTFKELKEWDKVDKSDLRAIPTSHPYWFVRVMIKDAKQYTRHFKQYELCKNDTKQIKLLYNATTSLEDIKAQVDKYKYCIDVLTALNIKL